MQYFVQRNLNHDGKEYRVGDTIYLDPDTGAQLEMMGALSVENTAPARTQSQPEPVQEVPQPQAGGVSEQTGEPSVDGRQDDTADVADTATDITPGAQQQEKDISADL
jgi:hypothetical protein